MTDLITIMGEDTIMGDIIAMDTTTIVDDAFTGDTTIITDTDTTMADVIVPRWDATDTTVTDSSTKTATSIETVIMAGETGRRADKDRRLEAMHAMTPPVLMAGVTERNVEIHGNEAAAVVHPTRREEEITDIPSVQGR
jgi:hypothetical protein